MAHQFALITLVAASGLIYVFPSLVAVRDKSITPDHVAAMIVNAMAGWTIVGWFFALFLALHREDHETSFRVNARNRH